MSICKKNPLFHLNSEYSELKFQTVGRCSLLYGRAIEFGACIKDDPCVFVKNVEGHINLYYRFLVLALYLCSPEKVTRFGLKFISDSHIWNICVVDILSSTFVEKLCFLTVCS